MGIEGSYLNIIKAIYDKLMPASYLWAKTISIPLKTGKNTGMPNFTSLIQHNTRSPGHSNQTGRRNKSIQIAKEEVKLSLFEDDVILYI